METRVKKCKQQSKVVSDAKEKRPKRKNPHPYCFLWYNITDVIDGARTRIMCNPVLVIM